MKQSNTLASMNEVLVQELTKVTLRVLDAEKKEATPKPMTT